MSKYLLHIGCHRKTITSRDSTVMEFETEEDAIKSYKESRNFYHSIGYVIWFAKIVYPDGSQKMLEQNPYY